MYEYEGYEYEGMNQDEKTRLMLFCSMARYAKDPTLHDTRIPYPLNSPNPREDLYPVHCICMYNKGLAARGEEKSWLSKMIKHAYEENGCIPFLTPRLLP